MPNGNTSGPSGGEDQEQRRPFWVPSEHNSDSSWTWGTCGHSQGSDELALRSEGVCSSLPLSSQAHPVDLSCADRSFPEVICSPLAHTCTSTHSVTTYAGIHKHWFTINFWKIESNFSQAAWATHSERKASLTQRGRGRGPQGPSGSRRHAARARIGPWSKDSEMK